MFQLIVKVFVYSGILILSVGGVAWGEELSTTLSNDDMEKLLHHSNEEIVRPNVDNGPNMFFGMIHRKEKRHDNKMIWDDGAESAMEFKEKPFDDDLKSYLFPHIGISVPLKMAKGDKELLLMEDKVENIENYDKILGENQEE